MRKYIITSPNFTGQVEILFDENGLLQTVDFRQCSIKHPAAIETFKSTIPATIKQLEDAFKGTKATIIEADYEVSFDDFWEKYNKKINKKRCLPLWAKLTKAKQIKAIAGITRYDRFLQQTTRGKLDPENYLRNEAWENEWR